jgi:hypothetical protein
MNDAIKLSLSADELELVCNKDWILTKKIVIDKVYFLMGELSQKMQQQIDHNKFMLPTIVTESSPKISRGENYRGLPYVMLDYPRYFKAKDALAIRTFFWWGNFFSINLHLSGVMKENALPILKSNFNWLQQNNYYLSIHSDPWEHHFEADNYRLFKNYSTAEFEEIFQQKDFLKIGVSISLKQWQSVPAFLEHHFTALMDLLKN